jgi:putative transposase
MPHFVLFYHVVWATKHRAPSITPPIETLIHNTIGDLSGKLRCTIHEMYGVSDHLHVAVTIPPSLAIAVWVSKVKGASSFEVNAGYPQLDATFKWQEGYSVHSFGASNKEWVCKYIQNQKQHHAEQTTKSYLEYIPEDK